MNLLNRIAFAFVAWLCCSVALAADAPKRIDFTQVITDQDDKPIVDCLKLKDDRSGCADEKTLTLGWVSMQALNLAEQGISYSDSLKRGTLALRVVKAADAELSEEEITLIKTQLAKRYSPLVVARAVPMLNAGLK